MTTALLDQVAAGIAEGWVRSADGTRIGFRRLGRGPAVVFVHGSVSTHTDWMPVAELLANRNLLAALAGPSIALTVHAEGGARPVRLTGEDLTRVMVNLVKNSTEALPSGGRIHIGLREQPAAQGAADCLLVTVEDNGPGIPADAQETIFVSGYTSHGMSEGQSEGSYGNFALSHRGLGLTISRSIVEGAGGRITAGNREQGGARFSIELPLRKAN